MLGVRQRTEVILGPQRRRGVLRFKAVGARRVALRVGRLGTSQSSQ